MHLFLCIVLLSGAPRGFTLRSCNSTSLILPAHDMSCHFVMAPLRCSILHTMAALNGSSSRLSSRGAILLPTILVSHLAGSAEAFSLDRTPLLIANRRTGRCRTTRLHFASTSPLFSSLPVTSDTEAGIQTPAPQSQPSRLQSFRQIVLPRILFVAALFLSSHGL